MSGLEESIQVLDGQWLAFGHRWVITLLHFLWQAAVIGGVAAVIGRLLKRESPRIRYGLHSVALLAFPLCFVATFLSVEVQMPVAVAASSPIQIVEPSGLPFESAIQPTMPDLESPMGMTGYMESVAATEIAAKESMPVADWLSELFPYVFGCYLLGAGFFLVRLFVSICGGQRLRSSAKPIEDATLLSRVGQLSKQVGLKCVPMIAWCDRVAAPTVIGVIRPTILLPASLVSGLDSGQLAAILSHELAHIRRYDLWMNLAQRVIESLLFFHPAVWYVSRQLGNERESCCDDLVVSTGHERLQYAGALLKVAELCAAGRRTPATTLAFSGDRPTQLEMRINRLMRNESSAVRLNRSGAIAFTLLLTIVLTGPLAITAFIGSANAEAELSAIVDDEDDGHDAENEKDVPNAETSSLKTDESEFAIVFGMVQSRTGELVELSLGEDAGLKVGDTLLVVPNAALAVGAASVRFSSMRLKRNVYPIPARTARLQINKTTKNSSSATILTEIAAQPIQPDDIAILETLDVVVEQVNQHQVATPAVKGIKPLTVDRVLKAIKSLKKETSIGESPAKLSLADFNALQASLKTKRLPANASLRSFVRQCDGHTMSHGSWVRLVVERKGWGPFVLPIHSESIFERPCTQIERKERDSHSVLIGRLVTYFKTDPKFGTDPKQTADYDQLLTSVRNAIGAKDEPAMLKLFHFEGLGKNHWSRKFARTDIANLLKRGVKTVSFERRGFTGDAFHWQTGKTYVPNLRPEGYVTFHFADKNAKEPSSLRFEVGAAGGDPRFVCYVVQSNSLKDGTKLSGSASIGGGYNTLRADGRLESSAQITAPVELKPLEQANYDLWIQSLNRQPAVEAVEFDIPPIDDQSAEKTAKAVKALLKREGAKRTGPSAGRKMHVVDKDGNITELRLNKAKFEDGEVTAIGGIRTLQKLYLTSTNVTDKQFDQMMWIHNLTELYLDDTQVGDDCMARLSAFQKLEQLSLAGTKLTDDGLGMLKRFKSLRYLSLARCKITDNGIKSLADVPNLETLRLSETNITDAAIESLKSIKSLRSLVLDKTKVTQAGLDRLAELPHFQWIASPETTIKELASRLADRDFEAVAGMENLSLAFPRKGKLQLISLKPVNQSPRGQAALRQQWTAKFSWEQAGETVPITTTILTDRGSVRLIQMGIDKEKQATKKVKAASANTTQTWTVEFLDNSANIWADPHTETRFIKRTISGLQEAGIEKYSLRSNPANGISTRRPTLTVTLYDDGEALVRVDHDCPYRFVKAIVLMLRECGIKKMQFPAQDGHWIRKS